MNDRIALARRIIDFGLTPADISPGLVDASQEALLASEPGSYADLLATQHDLSAHWPPGLAPIPTKLTPPPDPDAALPNADYLVITWTVAELAALVDILTPGISRTAWHPYTRNFANHYVPLIRRGAPALAAQRLASYMPTRIGDKTVLCVKSELHLNQDSIRTGDGTATLPVLDLFTQIIDEVKPKLIITTGTAGAVYADHELGDVMITRAAQFRARQEFRNEPWANQKYTSDWTVNTSQFDTAAALLALHADQLTEPDFGPPTTRYDANIVPGHHNIPDFKIDGRDFPAFHPILTTDYFEFGTSTNNLAQLGCGVEMGDAVLGMSIAAMAAPPRWLVIRNASDPRINGALPTHPDIQAMWAVWFYETYGYWTTISSAIACWAVIAGDS